MEPSRAYYIALFVIAVITILSVIGIVILGLQSNPSDTAKQSNEALIHIATAGSGLFVGLVGGKSIP